MCTELEQNVDSEPDKNTSSDYVDYRIHDQKPSERINNAMTDVSENENDELILHNASLRGGKLPYVLNKTVTTQKTFDTKCLTC